MAEFENKTIADLLARAKRAAAEAKDYDVEKPNISFVELLQNDEAWTVVTTLANKGYRGQPLTQKLNAVFELPEDGGLTRAAVTKAIRTEAWRRQDAAEKSGNAARTNCIAVGRHGKFDGLPDAGDGRLRSHPSHPAVGAAGSAGGPPRVAGADCGVDRPRYERRPGQMLGSRHG
jgi:hypothetical protein